MKIIIFLLQQCVTNFDKRLKENANGGKWNLLLPVSLLPSYHTIITFFELWPFVNTVLYVICDLCYLWFNKDPCFKFNR